tara:strand:- start:28063 stop:28674 length:612 start_codon:yes stop_codon:yes gene_type:complete
MNKINMAYLLIIIGLAITATGGYMLTKTPSKAIETQDTNTIRSESNNASSFEENKAKGDAFEKFVVKQFNKKYFTLQEWRGDKYVEGTYPVSNHFPDLEVSFELKEVKDHFAVECKWRKDYYKGAIKWANDNQIVNYKEYAQKTKLPVYVVIGVGGTSSIPNELFVIPLAEIKYPSLYKDKLAPYKKEVGSTFFWDNEKKVLR